VSECGDDGGSGGGGVLLFPICIQWNIGYGQSWNLFWGWFAPAAGLFFSRLRSSSVEK